jgi:hypothetical protein
MARDAGGALARAGADRDALIDLLLEEMRSPARPTVVIVEDAHWADNASLDIVRYLARRVERLPAMLIVSYREEELTEGHPLRPIIGGFAGPSVLRMELHGLSDAAVAELAAEVGFEPGPVLATVGGNPFYLTEVLAAPGSAVPPSVRHAVLARLEALPRPCRTAIEQLAVIPSEVETWLVRALLPDPAVLEPAERRGMLVVAEGRVGFRHELARRVVELSLPPIRRVDYHRSALEALVAAGAEPSRLVHHAIAAGDGLAVARHATAAAGEAAGDERPAATFDDFERCAGSSCRAPAWPLNRRQSRPAAPPAGLDAGARATRRTPATAPLFAAGGPPPPAAETGHNGRARWHRHPGAPSRQRGRRACPTWSQSSSSRPAGESGRSTSTPGCSTGGSSSSARRWTT